MKMTNEEALDLAIKLSRFCDEMDSCENCIFSKPACVSDVSICGFEHKIPLEWSIPTEKLPKTEVRNGSN